LNMTGIHVLLGLPLARVPGKVNVMMLPGSGEAQVLTRSPGGRRLLAVLRRFADAIIILNPDMRKEVETLGFPAGRVHWFPCEAIAHDPPGDRRRAELRRMRNLPPDPLVVVFTGRFVESKLVTNLVAAFALVARTVPGAMLILAGDGPERPRIEEQVLNLGLADRICFTGLLDEVGVNEVLYASDLFAIVSAAEGIPCSLVEAMAAGLPCVVSDIAAMTQLVRNGEQGRVVAVGDIGATADAIMDLMRNPGERRRCGRSARLRVLPEFAVETVAARYRNLYETLLASGRGHR
jgi:glycosyltransferase involved in cell wall biosynthesis